MQNNCNTYTIDKAEFSLEGTTKLDIVSLDTPGRTSLESEHWCDKWEYGSLHLATEMSVPVHDLTKIKLTAQKNKKKTLTSLMSSLLYAIHVSRIPHASSQHILPQDKSKIGSGYGFSLLNLPRISEIASLPMATTSGDQSPSFGPFELLEKILTEGGGPCR